MRAKRWRGSFGEVRVAQDAASPLKFGGFVANVYFPFYIRKWKHSTREKNINRVNVHLVVVFKDRDLGSFKRDELQDFLDGKAERFSFSLVNHLRWDLKQIFDMAVAEGYIRLNPAILAFTPKEAKRPARLVMNARDVRNLLSVLDLRERAIAKLAILGGMRPGEIFGLRWGSMGENFAEVVERVYEGVLDSPKTDHSYRKVAVPSRAMQDLIQWRDLLGNPPAGGSVFPSGRGTPLSKRAPSNNEGTMSGYVISGRGCKRSDLKV